MTLYFFLIRNLPGASVRNPARDKVMRKEADIGVLRLQGPLWKFLSMYLNKNLPVFVLCFFTLLTFSGKVNSGR